MFSDTSQNRTLRFKSRAMLCFISANTHYTLQNKPQSQTPAKTWSQSPTAYLVPSQHSERLSRLMKMELLTRTQARVGTSTPKSNFFELHPDWCDIKCLALTSAAVNNLKETSLISLPKPTPKTELSRDVTDLHTMCSPFKAYLETKEWKVVPGNILSSRTKGKQLRWRSSWNNTLILAS